MNPRQIDRVHILFLFVTSHVATRKNIWKGNRISGGWKKSSKKKEKGLSFQGIISRRRRISFTFFRSKELCLKKKKKKRWRFSACIDVTEIRGLTSQGSPKSSSSSPMEFYRTANSFADSTSRISWNCISIR